jgi:AsmA protein
MARFFLALAALAALIGFTVIVAPAIVPASAYKARLETAATNAIGRKTTIGGDIAFRLVPSISFTVKDLRVANAAGFPGEDLARIGKADIGVRLGPLLSGKVVATRFSLDAPTFNLQRAADGRVNWNLAAKPSDGAPPPDVNLGVVTIRNGAAAYNDAKDLKTYAIADLAATARLVALAEPFELDGTMTFQGAPTTLSVVVNSLAGLAAKEGASLKLNADVGDTKIGVDMMLAAGEAFAWKGPLSFDAPNLPGFAALFGVAIAEAPGFDRLSLSGEASGAATSMALSPATINFDKIVANGDLALDWSAPKMRATGSLATETLDLRPYLPPPAEAATGFPAWSTEKFDFTGLRNIDADIELRAGSVFFNELKAGATRAVISVRNGRLTADIPQTEFYGGDGQGRIVVDATKKTPAISGRLAMTSVAAQPFSLDLMRTDRLLGLGGFTLDFKASGASQAALMQSIDGEGGFDLADGAIKGFNIAKLAAAIGELYEGGITNPNAVASALSAARRPDEKTDFSKLLSEFTIENGVVSSPTITLEGPYLTMTGAGIVDLANQTLDLRLLPRASTSADNKTGRMIAAPLRVGGTFSKPTTSVDVESLVKGKAEETLRNFFDGATKRKRAKPAEGEESAAPAQEPAPSPERQILDSILKPAQPSAEGEAAPQGGVRDAIGGLFGRKPKPAPETAEDPAAEDGAAVEN